MTLLDDSADYLKNRIKTRNMNKKEVKTAPLRSLNDFLLESARFELPSFKDVEKWGKRVTCNLLYYQTNYALMAIVIFLIFGVLHPLKIAIGSITVIVLFLIFYYVRNEKAVLGHIKRSNPVIFSLLIFSITYYFLAWIAGSLVVFLLAILIPFCATFIHASLRIRNLKNKVVNRVEVLGFSRTPMGIFLEEMGLEPDIY